MAGYDFYGKALIPSFRPTHVAVSGQAPEADFAKYVEECLSGWGSYVPGTLHTYKFCPRENGGYRFALTLGEVYLHQASEAGGPASAKSGRTRST